jgi:hypothetical protein
MAKITDNNHTMALRMRSVDIPDHVIEDLTGVKLPTPNEALDELVTESEGLGLYDEQIEPVVEV